MMFGFGFIKGFNEQIGIIKQSIDHLIDVNRKQNDAIKSLAKENDIQSKRIKLLAEESAVQAKMIKKYMSGSDEE